jgi:hypothetical protein
MTNFKYSCIYNDADGESHFRNMEIEFLSNDSRVPRLLKASAYFHATHWGFLAGSPGWILDWHTAPQHYFVFWLAGQIEVTVSDGETRTFGAGDILLCEDATGKGHLGRGTSSVDVLAALVYLPD